MRLLLLLVIFWIIASGSAFEVSPAQPNPGDTITLEGTASPGQEVSLGSSFSLNLPVSAGKYEYATEVTIPQKPNRITVTARDVEDFNAGVKMGIWITKSFPASSGTAMISQRNVPPGRYDLKMFGNARPGSTNIPVSVEAETEVKADSQGRYALDIDTSGIPAGEYRIEAGGETKTIQIGSASLASSSGDSSPSDERGSEISDTEEKIKAKPSAKPVRITPVVIRWYANGLGLDAENTSQYEEAERLLKKRISDGYWKIIARGEPLTEEAGDCLQEYCLVRGSGACQECRDKDILLKGSYANNLSANESAISLVNKSDSPTSEPVNKGGFWSRIWDWVSQLFGLMMGAAGHIN